MRPRDIVMPLYVQASVYVYSLAQNRQRQRQGRLGTMGRLVSHEHNDAATINCFYNNILSRLNLLLNESSILFRAGLLLSGAELYIQLAEKTRRYFTQIDLLSF